MPKTLRVVDLFCGAGGTSTGMRRACDKRGYKLKLTAVNHWKTAVATHSRNHPDAKHVCARIEDVRPQDVVSDGRTDVLVASPECTWHSAARGAKPINDQMRASAWRVVDWVEALQPHSFLIENVREFEDWGPLDSRGRKLKSKRGHIFQAYLNAFRALNYNLEMRLLIAADYGDATTRERLFIIGRRGRRPILWPEATHSRVGDTQAELFGSKKPWRAAREVLKLDEPGRSIFARKKPLSQTTLARIEAGIRKFLKPAEAAPFLVILRNHMNGQSVDQPFPTITAGGKHIGLCTPVPFMLGQQSGGAPRSIDNPMPTIATDGAIALCQPFIATVNHSGCDNHGSRVHSVEEPLGTITSKRGKALVIPYYGTGVADSVDDPLATITTKARFGLAQFMVGAGGPCGSAKPRSVDEPMKTILAQSRMAVVQAQSFMVPYRGERSGQRPRTHSVDNPVPTITTNNGHALVQAFQVQYTHTDGDRVRSIDEPMPTLCTKAELAVAQPVAIPHNGNVYYDIYFRMVDNDELAAATGFPEDYEFDGRTAADITKQIGNAVPVNLAEALSGVLID